MTTSGSTDWTRNRDEIIKGALRTLGVLATGETPDADTITESSEALNMMIKGWQAEGIGLWLIDTSSITLVADQASYTMYSTGDVAIPQPLDIVEARFYNVTSGTEIPMTRLSRQEYYALPDKTSTGIPTQYYPDRRIDRIVFYIWPVWDDTTLDTIKFSYKTQVEDFDAIGNTPDFPVEWIRALKFNLGVELAPEYGKEVGPTLAALAASSKETVTSWDREHGSIFFGIERR